MARNKLVSEPSSAMAPDTRSTNRLDDLEQRVEMQAAAAASDRARLEQNSTDIADIKFSISRIENSLKDLAAGVASLAPHGQGDNNGGSLNSLHRNQPTQFGSYGTTHTYFPPTKQARVEFPRFDGTDFRGWVYRCRQFFIVDATPPEQRIRLISIHLEGKALKWHLNFMKTRRDNEVSWQGYLTHMEARFSDATHINPMVQLKQLQQITSVDEYIEAFDDLLTEIDIPEPVAMDCFLGGLRLDIQSAVDAFKPTNLPSMMQMARIQERTINAWRRPTLTNASPGRSFSAGAPPLLTGGSSTIPSYQSTSIGNSPLPPNNSSFSSTLPPKKPSVTLSKKDMEDRRRRGLCYWCNEKYTSSHICKESQVMMLVVRDMADDNFVDAQDSLEQGTTEGPASVVSAPMKATPSESHC